MRTFILAMLALIAGTVMAQTHYDGNIAIGIKGGAVLSKQQFTPSVPQTFMPGMLAGVTFRYIEERHFGLIAEVNLEQRGWKETFDKEFDYNYSRRLTYAHIPLLTHIYFGSNKMHGFFNLGPEVAFMLSENTKANFDYEHVEQIDGFPSAKRNTEQYNLKVKNKFDYGITAGLGMEVIGRNKHSFVLEGRFYYGLRDIFSNHTSDAFSGSSGMAIAVTLGYHYRIK